MFNVESEIYSLDMFLLIFDVFVLIILIEYWVIFESRNLEYMTIKEATEKWNPSVRRVQTICNEGMVQGVIIFGHAWVIPKEAEKPADMRIKTKMSIYNLNSRLRKV